MSFDATPGQKAFLTGCWLLSLAATGFVLVYDLITGRKPHASR